MNFIAKLEEAADSMFTVGDVISSRNECEELTMHHAYRIAQELSDFCAIRRTGLACTGNQVLRNWRATGCDGLRDRKYALGLRTCSN